MGQISMTEISNIAVKGLKQSLQFIFRTFRNRIVQETSLLAFCGQIRGLKINWIVHVYEKCNLHNINSIFLFIQELASNMKTHSRWSRTIGATSRISNLSWTRSWKKHSMISRTTLSNVLYFVNKPAPPSRMLSNSTKRTDTNTWWQFRVHKMLDKEWRKQVDFFGIPREITGLMGLLFHLQSKCKRFSTLFTTSEELFVFNFLDNCK